MQPLSYGVLSIRLSFPFANILMPLLTPHCSPDIYPTTVSPLCPPIPLSQFVISSTPISVPALTRLGPFPTASTFCLAPSGSLSWKSSPYPPRVPPSCLRSVDQPIHPPTSRSSLPFAFWLHHAPPLSSSCLSLHPPSAWPLLLLIRLELLILKIWQWYLIVWGI